MPVRKGRAPEGGLAMAALPYQILDGRSGRQVEEAAFWARPQRARAICVGEEHPNPHHHWVQLRVVEEIGKRKPAKLALGLEMIQRPFQGPLDDYQAKRIDAAAELTYLAERDDGAGMARIGSIARQRDRARYAEPGYHCYQDPDHHRQQPLLA